MHQIPLQLVPKPADKTRTVLAIEHGGKESPPIVQGDAGDIEYICGNCDHILVTGVKREQIENIVFLCSACGLYNETDHGGQPNRPN
jgi:hypothetical protein